MNVHKRHHLNRGFTLIELVIVIVIIGILAAVAITKYSDLTSSAKSAAMDANTGAVRSGYAVYLASNAGVPPTVTQLATTVQAGGGVTPTAAATGVQFTVSGTTYTVLTYTDSSCATATTAVTDSVQCVGNYS